MQKQTLSVASLIKSMRVRSLRSSWCEPDEFVKISTPSSAMSMCGLCREHARQLLIQMRPNKRDLRRRGEELLAHLDADARVLRGDHSMTNGDRSLCGQVSKVFLYETRGKKGEPGR